VPTRLQRLADGDFDAILLAGAGVERLNEASDVLTGALAQIERIRLDPEEFVPAPAQGALAVQCRAGDETLRKLLTQIDDPPTRSAVEIERAALKLAEGGCDTAFGAYARNTAAGMTLDVMLERNGRVLRGRAWGLADTGLAGEAMGALERAARDAQ
jgi:hydroxymethylbilane synthase